MLEVVDSDLYFVQDKNNFINPLLQVGSGSGSRSGAVEKSTGSGGPKITGSDRIRILIPGNYPSKVASKYKQCANTVRPTGSYPLNIVSYYKKWVSTSWTHIRILTLTSQASRIVSFRHMNNTVNNIYFFDLLKSRETGLSNVLRRYIMEVFAN